MFERMRCVVANPKTENTRAMALVVMTKTRIPWSVKRTVFILGLHDLSVSPGSADPSGLCPFHASDQCGNRLCVPPDIGAEPEKFSGSWNKFAKPHGVNVPAVGHKRTCLGICLIGRNIGRRQAKLLRSLNCEFAVRQTNSFRSSRKSRPLPRIATNQLLLAKTIFSVQNRIIWAS